MQPTKSGPVTRLVVAGLVPAIHVFATKTWMPGTRPGMTREKKKCQALR
jgi:hypothetical protein